MSRKMKVLLNLLTLAIDPEVGQEGDVYFNVTSKNLRIFNGFEWIELTPPSTDPTPFYRHTHAYDGEVATIDMQNPITFLEYNEIESAAVILPEVVGMDGGSPVETNVNPSWETLTLFDGGTEQEVLENENLIDGGGSEDIVGGDILDVGGSHE